MLTSPLTPPSYAFTLISNNFATQQNSRYFSRGIEIPLFFKKICPSFLVRYKQK